MNEKLTAHDGKMCEFHGGSGVIICATKKRHFIFCLSVLLITAVSTDTWSFGFPTRLESISDAGDASAGGAAVAEDASTNYTNPAGMVRIRHPQLVGGLYGTYGTKRFTGTTIAGYNTGRTVQLNNSLSTTQHTLSGNAFFTTPVYCNLWLGVGLTPLGLGIDYPPNAFTRYFADRAFLKGTQFNINVAMELTRQFTVAYGFDAVRIETRRDLETLNFFGGQDWTYKNYSTGVAFGFNLAFLYQFCQAGRVGLSYRSKMNVATDGYSQLDTHNTFNNASSDNYQLNFTIPATTTLSVYYDLTRQWAIMGTAEYQEWSEFDQYVARGIASPLGSTFQVLTPQSLSNTLRLAVGAHYKCNPKWLIRFGGAYDPSAVSNTNRTLLIPFDDVWSIAAGAHYQPTCRLGLDLALIHQIYKSAQIEHNQTIDPNIGFFTTGYTISETGKHTQHNNIIAGQLSFNLD